METVCGSERYRTQVVQQCCFGASEMAVKGRRSDILFSRFFEFLNFSQSFTLSIYALGWIKLPLFQRKERMQGLSMSKSSNSRSVNE
jgi:hypothetical protein